MTVIDSTGSLTKRAQLREILAALVRRDLHAGQTIPSERDIMSQYGVSRMTVREAIGDLVRSGLLYRVHGKGTFVAEPRVESELHLASFSNDMRARGHQPGTVLLHAEVCPAPPETAARLHLDAGASAFRVDRLRTADSIPMAIERGWYSPVAAPTLLDCDLTASLYTTLAEHFGVVIDSGEQTVATERADASTARFLDVPRGAPLLVFHRVARAGTLPVEDVVSHYRGDRYQIRMRLTGD